MWAAPRPNTPGKAFTCEIFPQQLYLNDFLEKDMEGFTSLGMSWQTCSGTVDGSFVHTGTSTSRHSFFVTFGNICIDRGPIRHRMRRCVAKTQSNSDILPFYIVGWSQGGTLASPPSLWYRGTPAKIFIANLSPHIWRDAMLASKVFFHLCDPLSDQIFEEIHSIV